MTNFNPEDWLETAVRGLKDYASAGVDAAVQNNVSQDSGLDVFEVMMEFPSDEKIITLLPGKKSIIHFELDDIQDHILGFGKNVAKTVYDPINFHVSEQEGRRHILNFDVGIWTWDKSGGTTARFRARQILTNLFTGSQAIVNLREATDGGDGQLELLDFTGGHFTTDQVNDVRVFRQVNTNLQIRVFSRTPNPVVTSTIEDIGYDLGLVIDDNLQL